MSNWTILDGSKLRASCPFKSGKWIRLRRKHHFACIPPNGAVLPYGIFATLVKVPVIEVPEDAQSNPNTSETLVQVMTDDASLWMEEVYGKRLSGMIRPFYGYHDFTVLCGGLPVHISSRDAKWTASFSLRGEQHIIQDLDYEGLAQKLIDTFSGGTRIVMPKIRAGAFAKQLAAAIIRSDLTLEALACETMPDSAPPELVEQAAQTVLKNCDLLRRMRSKEVREHRLALGIDDPRPEDMNTSHGSVESLLSEIRKK